MESHISIPTMVGTGHSIINVYVAIICVSFLTFANAGGSCKDKNTNCPLWKYYGHCSGVYSKWMAYYCPKSCKICIDEKCQDMYTQYCPYWKNQGYCIGQYGTWMSKNCPKSCNICIGGGFKCDFDDSEISQTRTGAKGLKSGYHDVSSSYVWLKAKVPYYFNGHTYRGDEDFIRNIMNEIEAKTCFKFEKVNREPNKHHLEINVSDKGTCLDNEYAGKVKTRSNNENKVMFESTCRNKGGVLHELMHVLGMGHTHQRPDRSLYINIIEDNIKDMDQYQVCEDCKYYGVPYDCNSIMHYGYKMSSKYGKETMTSKSGSCKLTPNGPAFSETGDASTTDWEVLNVIADEVCPEGKIATTCEWENPTNGGPYMVPGQLNLECKNYGTGKIKISYALYGRTNLITCVPHSIDITPFSVSCSADNALTKVKQLCEGKESCTVTAGNAIFGDPCHGTWKYLTVAYSCPDALKSSMTPGERLNRDSVKIMSRNGEYKLLMNTDGDLIIQRLKDRSIIWRTYIDIKNCPGAYLIFQSDGNLVIYDKKEPQSGVCWASHTDGQKADTLILRDDGKLVLMNGEIIIWKSGLDCPKERGFCGINGHDQNKGVRKLDDINAYSDQLQEDCLSKCINFPGATGCEAIWSLENPNRGCYVHTETVNQAFGGGNHVCWLFSKCKDFTPVPVPRHSLQRGSCPSGWTSLATGCYRFLPDSGYAETFEEAKSSCASEGGYLVEINSQEEQNALVQFSEDNGRNGDWWVWLGATDRSKEGEWIWINSGQKMTFNAWHTGEPNNVGNNEDCLVAWFGFEWFDIPCGNTYTGRKALCEHPGSVFLLTGGYFAQSDLELFHPTKSIHCSITPPILKNSWYSHNSFYHQNTIYLCGGRNTGSICISYNSKMTNWKTHTLSPSRGDSSSVVLRNTLFLIGGIIGSDSNGNRNYHSVASTSLPMTNTPNWTPVSNLKYKGHRECSMKIDSDSFVITGGGNNAGFLSTVTKYNSKTNTATTLPSLLLSRWYHGCVKAEIDNKKWLFVSGGFSSSGFTASTEMLELGGRQWVSLGDLIKPRLGHIMVSTERGILVIGGYSQNVEMLEWSSKEWKVQERSIPTMRIPDGGLVEIPESIFNCRGMLGKCGFRKCSSLEGCILVKDRKLTSVKALKKEFFISFEFRASKYIASLQSVLHFTENKDCCDIGTKIPAVWVKDFGKLVITFPVSGNGNFKFSSIKTYSTSKDKWHRVEISQTLENSKYKFRVKIFENGMDVNAEENEEENEYPKEFYDVQVYAGNKNDEILKGNIKNLYINAEGIDKCTDPCPEGWTSLATGCYRFIDAPTFEEATTGCENERGRLIEIDSSIEREKVSAFYNDHKDTGMIVWLGATDTADEDDWRWIHSREKISLHDGSWGSGEPNDAGDNEDCLVAGSDFKWNDIPCDHKDPNFKALCEHSGEEHHTNKGGWCWWIFRGVPCHKVQWHRFCCIKMKCGC